MTVECSSRRIMAPFQGTLQAIRAGAAEAECRDGKNWIIYLTSESILSHTGMNEIRYGTWSAAAGLSRAKVQGSPLPQDHRDMLDEILSALDEFSHQIPFANIDYYEQWLVSKNDQIPIALLNTAIHRGEFNPKQAPYDWRPSQSILNHYYSEHGQVKDLIATFKSYAGIKPKAIWVRRQNNGTAHDLSGKELAEMVFPHTPVQPEFFEGIHRKLVNHYLEFDAPAILQLLALPESLRARLEQAAWSQPQRVAELYRLYPGVIDHQGLKVTLVKARLMGETGRAEGWHEPFLPYTNE